MSVNEYAADAMDEANLRYAGSLDGGKTDAEHTLPPYTAQFYALRRERLVLETGTPGITATTHICAADERISALQEQIDALRAALAQTGADYATLYSEMGKRIFRLEAWTHSHTMPEAAALDWQKRLEWVEKIVHAQLNADPEWRNPYNDPPLRTLPATKATELAELRRDYEHLRAHFNDIVAQNAALRAKWDSVPWAALQGINMSGDGFMCLEVYEWIKANAPGGAA